MSSATANISRMGFMKKSTGFALRPINGRPVTAVLAMAASSVRSLLAVLPLQQQTRSRLRDTSLPAEIAAFWRLVAPLAGARRDAPGGRLVRPLYWTPALRLASGDQSPARAGADRPGLRRLSLNAAAPRAPLRSYGTRSFKGWSFRGLRLRPGPCRDHPPSYMRLTIAISRAFDRLGGWIGVPSGPSQPAAKRRI